jgi:serine beta-lactamase-like protein LACTB, mitochondrial
LELIIFGASKTHLKFKLLTRHMKTQTLVRSLVILLICGSLSSCQKKPADQSIVRSSKYKKSVAEAYQKVGLFSTINYIPGLTVAVSIDNQLVWADGFGYSSSELKTKASPSHKFRIGQVSELITTLTAAKLYEDGKLKIDQPVSEMLPELFQKPAGYTIHQLGVHASGIRVERTAAGKGNAINIETLIPSVVNDSLLYEPGTNFLHTELGFDLIGHIIQKTNNEPFTQVVKKNLLDALKLTNTIQDSPYLIIENKSNTYDYDYIAQPNVSSPIDLRGKEASAGYLSSVIDLVKIGNTLLYPGFLKQETIDLITRPYILKNGRTSTFGFGLIVTKDNEGKIFMGQKGNVSGGSSILLIYPEDKLVIAIACNIGNSSWELPVFDIASIFRDQLHPERKVKKEEVAAPKAPETK